MVRKAVAENPNTPSKILLKLAKDGNGLVFEAVVENANTPLETLFKLTKDA